MADAINNRRSAEPRPAAAGTGRQTRPANWQPFSAGGLGIIPRRGIQTPFGFTGDNLKQTALQRPQRLMRYLRSFHPTVAMADWNAKRLAFPPGAVRIVAVKESEEGEGDDATDDGGTADLDALWNSLPAEIGDLDGLLNQLMNEALYTGVVGVEAVPGPRGTGVRRVWPVDGNTLDFGRDSADADLTAYQRQWGPGVQSFGNVLPGGWVRLNPERFFWRSVDPDVDDPYGNPVYASALSEALADLALYQDIRDAIHAFAHPRGTIGINLTELHKFAVEVLNLPDERTATLNGEMSAAQWVKERWAEMAEYVQTLKTDDWVLTDTNGDLALLTSASYQGIQQVLEMLRTRLMQALKTLPTLMGVNDGSTQTYTSVEFQVYAAGLETLRALVVSVVLKVAEVHLRLKEKALKARAKYEPIRTTDRQIEANAESVEIENAAAKRDQGWISQEEASIEVTGSGPVGEAPEPMNGAASADGGNLPSGSTQEEKDAAKDAQENAIRKRVELARSWRSRRERFEREGIR